MNDRFRNPFWFLFCPTLLLCLAGATGEAGGPEATPARSTESSAESSVTLKVVGEERDVGLRRMEILEKALSPELLERKRAFVRSREQEYNEKIGALLQRLTTGIGRNTVITHAEVDYLSPDFESQLQDAERITVTIVLDEDGLAKWASDKDSPEEAEEALKALIHRGFRIPLQNVTVVVAPN